MMKSKLLRLFSVTLAMLLFCSVVSSASETKNAVPIIFDTDMGNDVDDALALALIHNLQSRGELKLLAVTMTKDNVYAEKYVKMVNAFYGRPNIPIGYTRSGVTKEDGRYVKAVLDLRNERGETIFPVDFPKKEGPDYMEAVRLLRKTLAAQPDGQTVLVQVGFSTNLAALFDTRGDDLSPLSGRELFTKKVKYVSTMAGAFSPEFAKHCEYNIICDIPAAKKFFNECPVPIVASGFEIGKSILLPGTSVQNDYNYVPHHPVKEAYRFYLDGFKRNAATFDLTSVLYVARPSEKYFTLSAPGTIQVLDDGRTVFKPGEKGLHRFMILAQSQRDNIRDAFIQLCPEKHDPK